MIGKDDETKDFRCEFIAEIKGSKRERERDRLQEYSALNLARTYSAR